MMLMGRLAGAFDSWHRIASLLAHERHLVVLSVACLKHKVCFYRKRSCNMCKPHADLHRREVSEGTQQPCMPWEQIVGSCACATKHIHASLL